MLVYITWSESLHVCAYLIPVGGRPADMCCVFNECIFNAYFIDTFLLHYTFVHGHHILQNSISVLQWCCGGVGPMLTECLEQFLLKKLIVSHLVKFPTLCGTCRLTL